ncbi:hypothetical protein [Rhizobium leguminosarum]|uniref:hypothetical protein n=1 Tax=Rhizobium leguminosarum TaxID=384 RepID=UPI0012BBEB67|nr:hypothetical protein [Rhizobium leguminosarum]
MADNERGSAAFFTYAMNNHIREGDLAVSILQGRHSIVANGTGKSGFKGVRIVSEPLRTGATFGRSRRSFCHSPKPKRN